MGLLIRTAAQGEILSTAVYSGCGRYRYSLARVWQPRAPAVLFVMLNPSTATEQANDPTLARCEGRARAMGLGGFRVVNLFGWRATDPEQLRQVTDPVGPANDRVVAEAAADCRLLICAWGNHGVLMGRAGQMARLLQGLGRPLHHLGLTRLGQPAHPLYLPRSRAPQPWDQAAISAISEADSPAPPATTPIA